MRRTKKSILAGVEGYIKSKVIDNNTIEIVFNNGDKAIRLHDTNIITIKNNGDYILTSGGWKTVTTKDRLNNYTPFHVLQNNGLWKVETSKGVYDFYDGITFDKDGALLTENKTKDLKEVAKIKKSIKNFVNLIDKMESIPLPASGDCWYCLMRTKEDGKSLGDSLGEIDHLQEHIKEGYIMGSLLYNALIESHYRPQQYAFFKEMNDKDIFKRTLTKYLQKRLIK